MTRSAPKTKPLYFWLGDYLAGALTGGLTALVVRTIVGPHWDMVVAMLVGMIAGMVVHLVLALVLMPLLGGFEVMIPGAMIGMYGGMLFGMRDSMQQEYLPLSTALTVGAFFGLVVVFGIRWWDRQLRGVVCAASQEPPALGGSRMKITTRAKWDRASLIYDVMTWGEDWRQGEDKQRLFAKIRGKTLLVAVGTGNDLKYVPAESDVVAIDISPRMIEKARAKAAHCKGTITLLCMDAQQLAFAEHAFDTVLTVCTFCSVPNPVQGLQELHRVLKPDGQLLMFEHVRSKIGPFAVFLDFMTFLTRRFGPDLNRDTVGNVVRAGFRLRQEENAYLDIVKIIEATK